MWAALASRSTGSQPVSTIGARMIASTPWAMNERIARIWFSCFPSPSANLKSTWRFSASAFIEAVLAVRHTLSAPVWAKPTLRTLAGVSAAEWAPASGALEQEAKKEATKARTRTLAFGK